MSVLTIARLTFREASRRWVLWVALLLGVAFLAIYALGFHEIQKDIEGSMRNMNPLAAKELQSFFLIAGLYVVNFLTVMMTVLTSVDTLSGEIASGTIQTIVSKPMQRWEVVIGKWLGFAGMLTMYLLLMAGGVMAVVFLRSGYQAPHALAALGLMLLNVLLLLSVSLLGGASLSTLANGVLVFGLYGIAFIGGWVEQFGAFLKNQTAMNIGIFCSLVMPSEAIWRRASFLMESPLVSAMGVSPFASSSVPSPIMIVYAVLYAAAALFLAVRQLYRRDL